MNLIMNAPLFLVFAIGVATGVLCSAVLVLWMEDEEEVESGESVC